MPASALTTTMPYWLPALFAWAMYRRIRRNFGMQLWRPVRAGIRLALLSLIACVLIAMAFLHPQTSIATGIGAVLGLGLGLLALKHTHVGWKDGQRSYTPNPWIGGALSAILLGRLAWRWTHGGLMAAQPSPSGLTLGLAAVLIAYSLAYIGGLTLQMRHLQAPAEGSTGI
jgi:phosphate/sulfate permease